MRLAGSCWNTNVPTAVTPLSAEGSNADVDCCGGGDAGGGGGGRLSVPWSSISARPEGVCNSSGSGFVDAVLGSEGERWRGMVGIFAGFDASEVFGKQCVTGGVHEKGQKEFLTRVGFEPTLFPTGVWVYQDKQPKTSALTTRPSRLGHSLIQAMNTIL